METSTCSYLSDITRENPFKFFVKSELSSVVSCSPQWPRLWRCPNDWYGPATSASLFLAELKSPKVWFDDNRERRARSSQHTRSVFLRHHRIILAHRWCTHRTTQLSSTSQGIERMYTYNSTTKMVNAGILDMQNTNTHRLKHEGQIKARHI